MNHSSSSSALDIPRQIATLLAILGTLAVNTISNLYPIKGVSIGTLANTAFKDVLVIPANYAFAIWGLIYLGLLAFGVYQLLPAQRHNPTLRYVDSLLIVACIAQIIWIYAFQSEYYWGSVAAMLGILLPLMGIYGRTSKLHGRASRGDRWCVLAPMSVYLGWISVATIVNVAVALYNQGWDGWQIAPQRWTVLVMAVAVMLAAIALLEKLDFAYPLVIVWALVAIALRHMNEPLVWTTAAGMAIALGLLVITMRLSRF
jgi:hypothetical protein